MTDPAPRDDHHRLSEVARLLDLDLPPETLPGVAANLALLAEHAARVVVAE